MRKCLYCEDQINGRNDKLFCMPSCKSAYNLKSERNIVMRSRSVRQYWRSTEKSNATVALATVSRFF